MGLTGHAGHLGHGPAAHIQRELPGLDAAEVGHQAAGHLEHYLRWSVRKRRIEDRQVSVQERVEQCAALAALRLATFVELREPDPRLLREARADLDAALAELDLNHSPTLSMTNRRARPS